MKGNAKKYFNAISKILFTIVLILAIALVGVRLIGFRPFVVLSGSMEPTFHVGSLIYVKQVPPEEIKVGDPITFVLDENLTVATHRVVDIDEENMTFTTKGDANEYEDGNPVYFKNLIGKAVFTIPKIGYFVNYVQNPPGKYLALAAGALIILLAFLPDLFEKDKKTKKE